MKLIVTVDAFNGDSSAGQLHGSVTRDLNATEDADNEENAMRLAEQMIRELFRRWRERKTA